MRLQAKDLNEMTDYELYSLAIQAQMVLIDKRNHHKADLEDKEKFDMEYAAAVNEVNSLKKGLNTLRLFSEKAM